MWTFLMACAAPNVVPRAPAIALTAPWVELDLPLDDAKIVAARPDSLIIDAHDNLIGAFQGRLEDSGWLLVATNDGNHGLNARSFTHPDNPGTSLLLGGTSHGGRSTYSLSWTTP